MNYKGVFYALAAALCFSLIPTFVKKVQEAGVSVFMLLSIRYIITTIILAPFAVAKSRHLHVPAKALLQLMLASGIFLALEACLYFYSLSLIPTSLSALILFTFPLMVHLIGVFRGKKYSLAIWAGMAVCIGGISLLLGTGWHTMNLSGIFCAFAAALSYAIYLTLIEQFTADFHPLVTNSIVSFSNAVSMTGVAIASGTFSFQMPKESFEAILFIVLISNVVGMQLFFMALKRLGAANTATINMAEPLFVVLIGWVFLKEPFLFWQRIGAGLLLAGLIFMKWLEGTSSCLHSGPQKD